MQFVLHLDDSTVARLVEPADAEAAVRAAFVAWGRGEAATTQRVRAATSQSGTSGTSGSLTSESGASGMASAMAAVVPPYCGGKLYATSHGRFTFLNVLFHTDGRLLATLDGEAITGLRTAAASALAIGHLAAPNATVAAVVGTGKQAWPHIEMLAAAVPALTELRVCGRGARSAARLAERAAAFGIATAPYDDPAAAVAGAQIIITVTSARDPLFPARVVAADALICAVGATKHDRAEIGADVVARCATVVCDDVTGSRSECGDLIRAERSGDFAWDRAIELHAVAAGTVSPPRAGAAPVLFETQGVAIQDVALSAVAYERHLARTDEVDNDLRSEQNGRRVG